MKLIILSITNYKEKDGIITALANDGVLSFNVRGLLDPKSKNHILNTPLLEVDVSFAENNHKYKTINSSKIVNNPYSTNDSLDKLAILSLIQESTNKMLQDEEKNLIYPILMQCLNKIKSGEVHPLQIGITYLLELLTITGNELDFSACVFCGNKKDIVNFSFADGGFVCRNCMDDSTTPSMNGKQMILFRNIFINKNNIENVPSFDYSNAIHILKLLVGYIYDALGIKLKTLSLIL